MLTPAQEDLLRKSLGAKRLRFLLSGVAGFIGSHILQALLSLKQEVIGLDNFSTGSRENLGEVERLQPEAFKSNFTLIEGDICDPQVCELALRGVDVLLHQAALGSVPRSVADPLATNRANIEGFLNLLHLAEKQGVERFVFASSSSVYGDWPEVLKKEEYLGKPLSPYAVSKRAGELYAEAFRSFAKINTIGFRYFNVFGERQNPEGPYAAVIPRWIREIEEGKPSAVFGDGKTSRDFCYVSNVVVANILAALAAPSAWNRVYNIAVGETSTLEHLWSLIVSRFEPEQQEKARAQLKYEPFRAGDVRHSLADISLAKAHLGYGATVGIEEGLELLFKARKS